jgi:molybdopterin-synthase adenylyltransferase
MSAAAHTHVTVVGAGGLGGPIGYALAAAGMASITVCDPDRVEASNLQRQIQFTTADVGRLKVEALAGELARRGYPRERVRALPIAFDADSAAELLAGADLVIDGSDSPATKFAVNDRSLAAGLPLVIASALRYGGNVFAGAPGAACYRCLFEDPPTEAPSCAEAGVLGAAVAVVGGAAAQTALALVADASAGAGTISVWDDVRTSVSPRRVAFRARPGCPACASAPADGHHKEAS